MSDDVDRVVALQNEIEAWHRATQRMLLWGRWGLAYTNLNASGQLHPGALPARLPFDLPLPSDSRIVGSLADETVASIYLDMDRSADEVWQFYRERLQAPEWQVVEPHLPEPSGFVSAMPHQGLLFCRGPSGPSLSVHAFFADGATQVMLLIRNDPRHSPCAPQPDPHIPPDQYRFPGKPLPILRAPAKAMMRPGSGVAVEGGGSRMFYQTAQAELDTELDLGAVADHFTSELEKAGWTRRDAGQEGRAAWSIWTPPPEGGETLRGLFFALRTGDAMLQNYFLYLRAGTL